jgi:hypothetical protein
MSDVSLSNSWLFGYYFLTTFYYFCSAITAMRSSWYVSLLFPHKGDWRVAEVQGGQLCRDLIAPLL